MQNDILSRIPYGCHIYNSFASPGVSIMENKIQQARNNPYPLKPAQGNHSKNEKIMEYIIF